MDGERLPPRKVERQWHRRAVSPDQQLGLEEAAPPWRVEGRRRGAFGNSSLSPEDKEQTKAPWRVESQWHRRALVDPRPGLGLDEEETPPLRHTGGRRVAVATTSTSASSPPSPRPHSQCRQMTALLQPLHEGTPRRAAPPGGRPVADDTVPFQSPRAGAATSTSPGFAGDGGLSVVLTGLEHRILHHATPRLLRKAARGMHDEEDGESASPATRRENRAARDDDMTGFGRGVGRRFGPRPAAPSSTPPPSSPSHQDTALPDPPSWRDLLSVFPRTPDDPGSSRREGPATAARYRSLSPRPEFHRGRRGPGLFLSSPGACEGLVPVIKGGHMYSAEFVGENSALRMAARLPDPIETYEGKNWGQRSRSEQRDVRLEVGGEDTSVFRMTERASCFPARRGLGRCLPPQPPSNLSLALRSSGIQSPECPLPALRSSHASPARCTVLCEHPARPPALGSATSKQDLPPALQRSELAMVQLASAQAAATSCAVVKVVNGNEKDDVALRKRRIVLMKRLKRKRLGGKARRKKKTPFRLAQEEREQQREDMRVLALAVRELALEIQSQKREGEAVVEQQEPDAGKERRFTKKCFVGCCVGGCWFCTALKHGVDIRISPMSVFVVAWAHITLQQNRVSK